MKEEIARLLDKAESDAKHGRYGAAIMSLTKVLRCLADA